MNRILHFNLLNKLSMVLSSQNVFFLQKGNAPKLIAVFAHIMLMFLIPVRLMQFDSQEEAFFRNLEELVLIFAVPCCWFYIIFFAGYIHYSRNWPFF